jgi:hypothetical protein
MVSKVNVSRRVRSCALAAVSITCLGFACVGCASAVKPTAAPTSAASRTATTGAAASSGKPANLVADTAVRQKLLAAFVAFRSNAANTPGYVAISPSAVAGISKGTLYYAVNMTTGTYWAVASFYATHAASRTSAFVGFQDGGNEAVFTRSSGKPWLVKSVGPCLAGLPTAVADTWALAANPSGMCPSGVPAG